MIKFLLLILLLLFLSLLVINVSYKNDTEMLINDYHNISNGNPINIINRNIRKTRPTVDNIYIATQAITHNLMENEPNEELNEIRRGLQIDLVDVMRGDIERDEEPILVNFEPLIDRIEDNIIDLDLDELQIVLFNDLENLRTRERDIKRTKTPKERYNIKVKSDPQNVHDSNLQDSLLNNYRAIISSNLGEGSIEECRRELIHLSPKDEHKINKVIDRIDNSFMKVSKYNDSERNILSNIWRRIKSPDNTQRYRDLCLSLKDAIVDSYNPVTSDAYCSNGRTARIISALSLVDVDPAISKPAMTDDILRKEVYALAYKILQNELKKIPSDVRDAYNNPVNDPVLNKQVEEFEEHCSLKMKGEINDRYKHINSPKLESIIESAIAGI